MTLSIMWFGDQLPDESALRTIGFMQTIMLAVFNRCTRVSSTLSNPLCRCGTW